MNFDGTAYPAIGKLVNSIFVLFVVDSFPLGS